MYSSVKREVRKWDIFRHYKGGVYIVDDLVVSADNVTEDEQVVLYSPIGRRSDRFTRLESEFLEKLTVDDNTVERFSFLPTLTRYYQRCKRIPGQDQLFPVYCEQDVLDLISAHQEIGQPIPEEQQKNLIAKTRSVLSYTTFLVGENQDAGVVVSIGGQWDLLRAKTITSLAAQIQSDRHFNMPSLTLLNSTKGLQ